jgi:predicted small secreted protein
MLVKYWESNLCRIKPENRRGPEKMVRKVLLVVALIGVVFSLTSCQTVQGIGADIQWIGEKSEEAIER